MNTMTRFLTWLDSRGEQGIGAVVRAIAGVLALVLRRGRHRAWRGQRGAA